MKKNWERDLEIYRLRKDEGHTYTVTKLANMFRLTRSRICRICEEIEHERMRFANSENPYFLFDLSLYAGRILWGPLRNKFGDEQKATPESVARLDPVELEKTRGLGKKTLKKVKEVLLRYNMQHNVHKNWDRY